MNAEMAKGLVVLLGGVLLSVVAERTYRLKGEALVLVILTVLGIVFILVGLS
jgi:uncharacterized membrane protein YqjE